jgi:HD superfamily phosphohydrolase
MTMPPDRPFVVRDPVHGYLSVAPHERLVVDAPITQRLRRIGQTGLAEMVFPEAKTSRFVHSLGAMHLASRFVIAALENATELDVQSFFEDVRSQIDWTTLHIEDLDDLLKHSGALDALAAVRFSSFVDPSSSRGRDNRRLLALVEGALRLAALFHDLGHLPFSHDGEYALKGFATYRDSASRPLPGPIRAIANAKAPHEEIGHALANVVFMQLPESKPAVRHVYSLAKKILDAPEPDYGLTQHQPASALQWLHSLVDSEIDVDRADYLLRDGQALGLDFAQYDLDRLVFNLVLIKTADRGYTTAVKESGLAALESYCLTRSRSHQVFVRHHKVTQVGTALRYALTQIMDTETAAPLLDFLGKLKGLESATYEDRKAALDQYAVLDDSWAFQALRVLQKSSANEPLLHACLGVALDRAQNLRSVWKRKGDLTEEQMMALKERVKELTSADRGTLRLQEARRRLLDRGVLFWLFNFKPYVKDRVTYQSVMLVQSKDRKQRPASEMSPLIRHLQDIWEGDIPIYAFTERSNLISIDELLDLMGSDKNLPTVNKSIDASPPVS